MLDRVAELEALLDQSKKGLLQSPISADAVAMFANRVYEGMNCVAAWREVPAGWIVDILNNVRDRVLDFVLEIERLDPDAGEAELGKPVIQPSQVSQVFNTTVYGGAASVVGTASQSQITTESVTKGDFNALRRLLAEHGIEDADLAELEEAVNADPKPQSDGCFGPRVAGWISKMVGKAATGAWSVATGIATNLLTRALGAYYGLPN